MKLRLSELRQIVREEILDEVGYRRPHDPAATPWARRDTGSQKPQPISSQEREVRLRGKWPERKVGGEKQVHADWPEIQHAKWSKKDIPVKDYEDWVKEKGHVTPSASSVMASYFIELGMEKNHEAHKMLAKHFGLAHGDVMRDINRQKSELQHIKEAVPAIPYGFADTASEEAKRINDQLGPNIYNMTLVTDQEHWESVGIHTGEELAISLLNSSYSDLYKSIHGVRPRHRFTNIDDVSTALNDLDEYYSLVVAQKEFDIEQQKEIDREKAELEALMPGEFDFEHKPKQVGMGRGARLKEFRQIIRNVITKES